MLMLGEYSGRTSFYSRNITQNIINDVCVLLPLLSESVNSHAVVAHAMEKVRKISERINPGQCPVITAD